MSQVEDRFTRSARRAARAAQVIASESPQTSVSPEHLLLALVRQDGCVAVSLIGRIGAAGVQVRLQEAMQDIITSQSADPQEGLEPGEIPRLQQVIDSAREEADQSKSIYLDTGHLLLGLLREGAARETLVNEGLDLDRARRERTLYLEAGCALELDETEAAMIGGQLTTAQAEEWEHRLLAHPQDTIARSALLGYYFHDRRESDDHGSAPHQEHVFWFIRNRPQLRIAGTPFAGFHDESAGGAFSEAKALWLEQVASHLGDTRILQNAAAFLTHEDKATAEALIQQAAELEPENPEWPDRLGHLYELETMGLKGDERLEMARKALAHFERWRELTGELKNDYSALKDMAVVALQAGESGKAARYAQELLELAARHKRGRFGNAIHHGNIVLGRLALQERDVERAKEYLLAAGETPGSPQLNSFGPDMTLARDLLERGERKTVLRYLEQCSVFWEKENLNRWISEVEGGVTPDFGPRAAA